MFLNLQMINSQCACLRFHIFLHVQSCFLWIQYHVHHVFIQPRFFFYYYFTKVSKFKGLSFDQQPLNHATHTMQRRFSKRKACIRWISAHRVKVLLLMRSPCECEAHINEHITARCRHFAQTSILNHYTSKSWKLIVLILTPQIINKDLARLNLHYRVQVTQFHFFSCIDRMCNFQRELRK